jgi:predicted heme/steroid binding protein/uncharacterized membrane protein
MKPFTKNELLRHDGRDGSRAFIAFQGKIYDVSGSSKWKNGAHMRRHQAGQDLTEVIEAAPHSTEVFDRIPQVGILLEESTDPQQKPRLIHAILDLHPHPMSVHFPIALSMTTALFTLAGFITNQKLLMQAGYMNLIVALASTPISIGAGILSHRYNYGSKWKPVFANKFCISTLLVICQSIAIIAGSGGVQVIQMAGIRGWAYVAFTGLIAPMVMILGYLGGTITFPRDGGLSGRTQS